MLPNVKSIADTKNQIVYYTILLIIFSYFPYLDKNIGLIYLVIVTTLNFFLLTSSIKLKKTKEKKSKPNKEGLKFFVLSIFYLFSLFSALLIDHLIKIWKTEEEKI